MDPATEPKSQSTKSSTAFRNPKRGLGAPLARGRTADGGTGTRTAALKPRHRGAAAGGWLGRNPISMATHISLPEFKLTEKQTPT